MEAPRKSIYAKAQTHMIAMLVAAPVIVWGVPLLLMPIGLSFETVAAIIIPLMIAWLLVGGVRSLLLACPRCGKSLFMRGFVSMPWPPKTCSRCGQDLTTS